MGDMADYIIDQGLDEWLRHLAGLCGEYCDCQYCREEEQNKEASDEDEKG